MRLKQYILEDVESSRNLAKAVFDLKVAKKELKHHTAGKQPKDANAARLYKQKIDSLKKKIIALKEKINKGNRALSEGESHGDN